MKKSIIALTLTTFIFGCSSLLKYKGNKDEFKNAEFDSKVKIVEAEDAVKVEAPPKVVSGTVIQVPPMTTEAKGIVFEVSATPFVSSGTPAAVLNKANDKSENNSTKLKNKNKPVKAKKDEISKSIEVVPTTRQPEIEDAEGFENHQRRPLKDPFKVGELVEHEVSYLGASAGNIKFIVKPFAYVNGRKTYNFFIDLKSNSFFSRVYAVDDQVRTYMDFETLVPSVFKLNIRDSGQVKEAQSYFDHGNLKADYWEHRYTESAGHEEKKSSWSILPYSQNPFSAIFYMRVFQWHVGKEYSFRVADDEKNVLFKGKALEKTKISTEAGTFDAIKIKAEVHSRGNLAKATDFYLWISDDDRKYVLRIEVKLPIGSLVSEVIEIEEGK